MKPRRVVRHRHTGVHGVVIGDWHKPSALPGAMPHILDVIVFREGCTTQHCAWEANDVEDADDSTRKYCSELLSRAQRAAHGTSQEKR